MTDLVDLSPEDALALAEAACVGAGARPRMARALAEATLAAELRGKPIVGFAHLPDYLDALASGRIDGGAEPAISSPAPALLACDVKRGVAQLGFDDAFTELQTRARAYGLALIAISNSFTTGELGGYVRRLADGGLVALAATNGPALMQPPGASGAVYCTNPIAFAAPGRDGAAVVIDQSSSHAAYVSLRGAASIPEGWAVDAQGKPTTDAASALGGALLSFGGARGGNIALMVEILAAGLSGANWSLDAPSFADGGRSPGVGLTVVAIAPALLAADFAARLEAQLARLAGKGVHIPGATARRTEVRLPAALLATLRRYAGA